MPLPHFDTPMFAGLNAIEAWTVVQMARIGTTSAGAYLIRRGESRAELYLLLAGRAEVRLDDGQMIRIVERGDEVGEMGCVRPRKRSADVLVVETVRYLAFDLPCLQRLRHQHPRIAAKLFRNISRILCDRLEQATDRLLAERPDAIAATRLLYSGLAQTSWLTAS